VQKQGSTGGTLPATQEVRSVQRNGSVLLLMSSAGEGGLSQGLRPRAILCEDRFVDTSTRGDTSHEMPSNLSETEEHSPEFRRPRASWVAAVASRPSDGPTSPTRGRKDRLVHRPIQIFPPGTRSRSPARSKKRT